MFKLQHQFNNIAETTQLTNVQMPECHHHCECLKCRLVFRRGGEGGSGKSWSKCFCSLCSRNCKSKKHTRYSV